MATKIDVNAIVRCPAHSGGFRVWQVVGIYHGGEKQESVVELITLDRTVNTQGRMIVPLELLESSIGASVFG